MMNLADEVLRQLTDIINKTHSKGKTEETLELIRAKARLEYSYNQFYKDEESEKILEDISETLFSNYKQRIDDNTILFFDGFGLDARGLIQIYLNALIANKYNIVYITCAKNDTEQPEVMSMLHKSNAAVYHLKYGRCLDGIRIIRRIFDTNKFSAAFLYTNPCDVVGTCVFNGLKGHCMRYLINLTDHAFWLGKNSFDYCIEFRNYGAAISRDYREISTNKLIELPYRPLINRAIDFQGFPFDASGKKIIFSGGSIYKTVDKESTYYKLIEAVLISNEDVIFIYASGETCSDLEALIQKYPEKAYYFKERKDLFQVLKNSYIYLNTYPISGALMLQYAALAGCVPVTLRRTWDEDATGILMNEDALGLTFVDFDLTVHEINKLLSDSKYYNSKRKMLESQVISEFEFTERLNIMIKTPEKLIIDNIVSVNTDRFRQPYYDNMSIEKVTDAIIARGEYIVYKHFPNLMIRKLFRHCKKLLQKYQKKIRTRLSLYI